jgi:serine/threonine protein kinase
VTPGRHWVRLYFYPFASSSFQPNNSFFSVEANQFVLLDNFSAVAVTAASRPTRPDFVREYLLNVTGLNLVLTFTPQPQSYAFINAIEVISQPNDLIKDDGILLGPLTPASIGLATSALQTMYRLNVGGTTIGPSLDSTNIGRTWMPDADYIFSAATGSTGKTEIASITYPSTVPEYIAPPAVYATARTLGDSSTVNANFNVTWILPVDANYTYFVRLHLCEIFYTTISERIFNVYINNQSALPAYDILVATQPNTPIYVDFVVSMFRGGNRMWVQIGTSTYATNQKDAILNGLEVFKVNNTAQSLAGPNPTVIPGATNTPSSSTTASEKTNTGVIIGSAIGGVAALAIFVILAVLFCRRRARSKGSKTSTTTWLPLPLHGGSTDHSKVSTTSLGGKSGKSGAGSYVSSAPSNLGRYFTFAELQEATNNFDENLVLGVGGFGKVYKGEIDDGSKVAVKRGNPRSEQGLNEFQTEIELLSKLRHRHLVSLIGYCEEHGEMILVYDYMANGPLRGHLYGTDEPCLSWKQRLEICIGAARGLHYLHTGAAQGIIHRDVKTTNILLDENFVAKVADFGLSKIGPALEQTHVSTAVKGSFGYLDPEYFRRQQLTEKSDVYSFGVVLMEVLCARPAINPALPREQVNMAEWAIKYQKADMLDQIVDEKLRGTISPDSLKKFGDTVEKCLEEQGIDRPAMGDVLWNLEYALQLQESSEFGSLASPEQNTFDTDSSQMMSTQSVAVVPNLLDSSLTVSTERKMLEETSSEDQSASEIFSQLVNPQGR